MRIAVIVLTAGGLALARRLRGGIEGACDIYAPGRLCTREPGCPAHPFDGPLGRMVAGLWDAYQGLIFICAAGIAVRVCAPLLKDKRYDPGVVVVDEQGKYAISLLSGHWGGANDLTNTVADLLEAQPVITTATDGQGKMGLDVLARRLNLAPDPFAGIKAANAALVDGETVVVYCEPDPSGVAAALGGVPPGLELRPLTQMQRTTPGAGLKVILSSSLLPGISGDPLYLRPRHLVVGVGCRRGTPAEDILTAIHHSMAAAGRSPLSIKCLASATLKQEEAGLHETAALLGVPLRFHPVEEINRFMDSRPDLHTSVPAMERTGVKAVCEPAALMEARSHQLLLPKTVYRKVTVAVAAAPWPW